MSGRGGARAGSGPKPSPLSKQLRKQLQLEFQISLQRIAAAGPQLQQMAADVTAALRRITTEETTEEGNR